MVLKFVGLTKHFKDKVAVDGISFSVGPGEIVGFIGVNGAGKTTSIRIAGGVLFPTSGDVLVNGKSVINDKKEAMMSVAWVSETNLLSAFDTPKVIFEEIGSYFGFDRNLVKERAEETMESVGLDHAMDLRIGNFSNGQKKRMALAIAIFKDAENLLLDETFSGLDPMGTSFLRELLQKLRNDGKSMLLSSHILKEVQDIADRIVVLHQGKIAGMTSMKELSENMVFEIECNGDMIAVRNLMEEYGKLSFHNGVFFLELQKGQDVKTWQIGKILSDAGVKVTRIEEKSESLERYFFDSIRKA